VILTTEVSNRFAALEVLDTEMEANSAWEMNQENITISAKESRGYYELTSRSRLHSLLYIYLLLYIPRTDRTGNIYSIISFPLVHGEATCLQYSSVATADVLPRIYTIFT
jgi:hypothetical protein